jgi:hypothetical protein
MAVRTLTPIVADTDIVTRRVILTRRTRTMVEEFTIIAIVTILTSTCIIHCRDTPTRAIVKTRVVKTRVKHRTIHSRPA